MKLVGQSIVCQFTLRDVDAAAAAAAVLAATCFSWRVVNFVFSPALTRFSSELLVARDGVKTAQPKNSRRLRRLWVADDLDEAGKLSGRELAWYDGGWLCHFWRGQEGEFDAFPLMRCRTAAILQIARVNSTINMQPNRGHTHDRGTLHHSDCELWASSCDSHTMQWTCRAKFVTSYALTRRPWRAATVPDLFILVLPVSPAATGHPSIVSIVVKIASRTPYNLPALLTGLSWTRQWYALQPHHQTVVVSLTFAVLALKCF